VNVGASSEEGEKNEEERIGCSAVCLPFKGRIGGTVRFLLSYLGSPRKESGTDRALGESTYRARKRRKWF